MRRKPGKPTCCAAAALVSLASGCGGAPGGQRVVFPVSNNTSWFGSSNIDEITDIGVPLFANRSDATVRLVSVQLVRPPPWPNGIKLM